MVYKVTSNQAPFSSSSPIEKHRDSTSGTYVSASLGLVLQRNLPHWKVEKQRRYFAHSIAMIISNTIHMKQVRKPKKKAVSYGPKKLKAIFRAGFTVPNMSI